MAYTEIEVSNLIQEVEKAFTAHLAKAEALAKSEACEAVAVVDGSELAKAEDKADEKEDKAPAKDEAEAPKSDEAPAAEEKEAAPAAEAPKDAPAAEAAEAPAAEAAPAAEGAAPAAAPGAEGDAHDYDDEDMAAMVQMYQGMSRGELKAHHDAIKQCLDSMGMEKCGTMAPAAAPGEAAPMAKSEDNAEVELLKSESAAKDSKIAELQKSLDTVTEIITKLVKKSAPAAKAVTKLEAIAKSEVTTEEKVLSKAEITAILNKKTMETSLSKSDREAINAYYAAGQVSTTGISHLLK